MECLKAEGRLVLPVFYGVDHSCVRHQTRSYGEAIAKHVERFQNNNEKYTDYMERLRKWKMALTQAAALSGKHFIIGNGYEHEFIGKIVKEISDKINREPLYVADYPVGQESRILPVKSLLDVGSDDGVLMVGIHGIGGMGKTTLARAIYNLIADQFEGLCFLHNVREIFGKHGLTYLQEKLLSKTIGLNIEIGDVNEGIPTIKRRLHRKKVLLVLDDVDILEQLRGLAGGLDWFGPGSRVIITTRDYHLLASHGIERTYVVDGLNKKEALELLRWKTSKNSRVGSSYKDILNRAVTYASGLPLALEVVGTNLFGKNIEECQSMLDRYESIPNKEIYKILKVSFDALEEDEQNVFLDICCCFKGYDLAELEDILHAHHDQCMKFHIRVLIEKSLINICQRGYVTLHDLIEDMGKEIVRQESPEERGKRSRLWFHKDIVQVLEENTGTSEIKSIYHDCPVAVKWNGKGFEKMKNLRTIIVKRGHFSEGPKYLPSSLRVLEWKRYPSQCIPSNFHPKNLAICKLPNSCLKSSGLAGLLDTTSEFVNLKVLNFDRCEYLEHIPDVSRLNLEELSFNHCSNLITIHHSIGFLNKLKILDARDCTKLRSFPPLKLSSLEKLQLSGCKSLKNFPEILGEMNNITEIFLCDTSIKELPFSFQNLTGLK